MDMIGTLAGVTVFTLMLSLGLNQPVSDMAKVWSDRVLLVKSLLAVMVIVPAVVMVMLSIFDLPDGPESALVILAAALAAPMTTKRAAAAGADLAYVGSLQLLLACLTILATPTILAVFYDHFDLLIERTSPLKVAGQIVAITFLPVVAGIGLRALLPSIATRTEQPVAKLADILFLLLAVAIVVALVFLPELRTKLMIGWLTVGVILATAALALFTGHVLGGPEPEHRGGLAIACVARNVGLAIYIAGASEVPDDLIPTIIVFMLLGSVLATPYSMWARRQVQSAGAG